MAGVTTLTFEVEEELRKAFSEAVGMQRKVDADVLRDLMRGYVEQQQSAVDYEAWFRRKVEMAVSSANSGKVIAEDEIEAEFAALRDNARRSSSR